MLTSSKFYGSWGRALRQGVRLPLSSAASKCPHIFDEHTKKCLELGTVAHAYNSRTWKLKTAGLSEVQGQPEPRMKL